MKLINQYSCCTSCKLVSELDREDPMFLGSEHVKVHMWNGLTLREISQDTCIIYVWRLPSLVCEHISYAAWCFSVTCFENISLSRAWLTNGIESLICPLLFFSLIIFVSPFLWPTWVYITQKKKRCAHIVEDGDADGMVEWPLNLFEWHWPRHLSIHW